MIFRVQNKSTAMDFVHVFVLASVAYAFVAYRDRYMSPPTRTGSRAGSIRSKIYTNVGDADRVSPISLMPELETIANTILDISPPAQEMNAKEVVSMIERFAMLFYRLVGKEKRSRKESSDAIVDISLFRARLLNAMQSLYVSSRRETHRKKLDMCSADLVFHTAQAVRLVRETVGGRYTTLYAPGNGFPSPIPGDLDDRFDKFVS